MSDDNKRPTQQRRLQTAALVVGYALSRLDRRILTELGFDTWRSAFESLGRSLEVPPNSVKGLRDEFDPVHSSRKGWRHRAMHPTRVRVVEDLEDASDAAILELVRRILLRDQDATREALDALVPPPGAASAAAQRLLTGRRAEEFVLANCKPLLGVERAFIRDAREDLLGFDFEIQASPCICVEVKGLQAAEGDLLFTDREWREAQVRRAGYWLAVVGNLAALRPRATVVRNPAATLHPYCRFERSVRPAWRTHFALDMSGAAHAAEP